MKTLWAALAATSVALVAPAAYAAPIVAGSNIDLAGFVNATGGATLSSATGLDFVNGPAGAASPGAPGTVVSYGNGSFTFAGLACPANMNTTSCGSIIDINNLTVGAQSIANFITLTGGNNAAPIAFDLSNITFIGRERASFLTFEATGTLRYAGFDPTPGTFFFSAQGSQQTSFSGSLIAGSAVPEPSAWALMLLGFGGVGYTVRRRNAPAARVRFA